MSTSTISALDHVSLAPEVRAALDAAPRIVVPASRAELYDLALGGGKSEFEVRFDVNGTSVLEATVVRAKNGLVVNYTEDYMRRRDPDSMRIGDDLPTDKPRYADVYGKPFAPLRDETLRWLSTQELIVVPFKAGGPVYGYPSLAIIPVQAAFFAVALGDLQGWVTFAEIGPFTPRSILYGAPPFRQTHFDGRQVVVHHRSETLHEIFAYNLYPGPSAKKGVFSVLLDIGQHESWLTCHASSVKVTTPYENSTVVMHEGASGGGKSEMGQDIHREDDGRILVGVNVVRDEPYYITLSEACTLSPITDDMTLCHPSIQLNDGRLVVTDAEDGWFVRVDGMKEYGMDPAFEKIAIQPPEPLLFLSLQGRSDATTLVWEHTLDSDGKPTPNPRVVVPRRFIRNVVDDPVEVDVRTFGVRMPLCTKNHPTYGIMGMMHIVPASLAWLWRLIAPRGDKNPSIGEAKEDAKTLKKGGLVSEGVGSFWPFSTGTKVGGANLMLDQLIAHDRTRYVLVPNQHIGAYKIGFAAEWLTREYLARRGGGRIYRDQLVEARCPLFGYRPTEVKLDGHQIRPTLLAPESQSQVGKKTYDAGAAILVDFFKQELTQYLTDDLHPLGRQIIEACLNDADAAEYDRLTPLYI